MTRPPLPMRHGGISSPRMRLQRARSSVVILGVSGLRRRAAEKPPEGSADKDRLTTLRLGDPRSPFKVYSPCDHRGPINTYEHLARSTNLHGAERSKSQGAA